MKKRTFLLIFVVLGVLFGLNIYNRLQEVTLLSSNNKPSAKNNQDKIPATPTTNERTSAFVPYWVLGQTEFSTEYDSLIYFGISPTTAGIHTTEDGYKNLPRFVNAVDPSVKTYLTVRMLNNDTSFDIIESTTASHKVITDTIATANKYHFDGIVLDLEVNALPFDSVTSNITGFTKKFSQAAKAENLEFGMTMYGDVYYRLRPFKVKELADVSDQIYIMSYDFHKARGNPGPNFPFGGKDTFGYDFQTMIDAFLKDVPAEKLTVIFGMFGYDWEVDEKGKATSSGEAMSYYKIKQNFLDTCAQKKCEYQQDKESLETKLTYTDSNSNEHIVWFETPTSVAEKKRFIKSKGISGISYWAYSYF